jgi:hypothetical protein
VANRQESPIRRPVSPWVGAIVILVCIVLVLVIYKFTVGRKVSVQAPPDADVTPLPAGPSVEGPEAGGLGGSRATPVSDDEVRTEPEEEKQPLPPGEPAKDAGG